MNRRANQTTRSVLQVRAEAQAQKVGPEGEGYDTYVRSASDSKPVLEEGGPSQIVAGEALGSTSCEWWSGDAHARRVHGDSSKRGMMMMRGRRRRGYKGRGSRGKKEKKKREEEERRGRKREGWGRKQEAVIDPYRPEGKLGSGGGAGQTALCVIAPSRRATRALYGTDHAFFSQGARRTVDTVWQPSGDQGRERGQISPCLAAHCCCALCLLKRVTKRKKRGGVCVRECCPRTWDMERVPPLGVNTTILGGAVG